MNKTEYKYPCPGCGSSARLFPWDDGDLICKSCGGVVYWDEFLGRYCTSQELTEMLVRPNMRGASMGYMDRKL